MDKEYIERNAAIEKTEAFCDVFVTQWTDEKVLAWIRNLPTADVVEVVRCKDCKYHKDTSVKMYAHCCLIGQTVSNDDFCSFGERRDDNVDM